MARRGSHQRPHIRRSKRGKRFVAGRGRYKPRIYSYQIHHTSSSYIPIKKEYKIPKVLKTEPIQIDDIRSILTNKLVLKGIATGLSIATGSPLPLLAYKIVSWGDLANRIANDLNQKKVDREIALAKELAIAGTNLLYERKIDDISKNISNSFLSTGMIGKIAQEAQLSNDIVNSMFEGTIGTALNAGLENLPTAVVETIW